MHRSMYLVLHIPPQSYARADLSVVTISVFEVEDAQGQSRRRRGRGICI